MRETDGPRYLLRRTPPSPHSTANLLNLHDALSRSALIPRGLSRFFGITLAVSLSACGLTGPDDDGSLVGVWHIIVEGDYESHLEFFSNGSWEAVDGDFVQEVCSVERGTWSTDGDVIHATVTYRDGHVDESIEVPFQLSGDQLTFDWDSDDSETYTRTDEMVDCSFYSWPTVVFTAEVDGVPMDFTDSFWIPQRDAGFSLQDIINFGNIELEGWDERGGDVSDCAGCRLLGLQLFAEVGTLVTGTYSVGDDGFVTGLRASGTYTPDFVTALGRYRTDGSDPSQQPWQGTVTVTSADADLFAGTFEFVAYDHLDAGPVRPLVTVTNGVFSIDYR